MRHIHHAVWLGALAILLGGCGGPMPGPSASVTPGVTVTVTPSVEPSPTATATPMAYPMRLEQVGQIGGKARRLILHGDNLYVQVGTRVLTVEVSVPTRPTVVGQTRPFEHGIGAMAAADGDHVLIADGAANLWMLSMPQRGDPEITGSVKLSANATGIAVAGQYAYLAGGDSGLVVVDISQPSQPAIAATLPLKGKALTITASNGLVVAVSSYRVDGSRGGYQTYVALTPVDIHDPMHPKALNPTEFLGDYGEVRLVGNTLYFDDGYRFNTYDVTGSGMLGNEKGQYFGDWAIMAGDYAFGFSNRFEQYTGETSLFTVWKKGGEFGYEEADRPIKPLPDNETYGADRIVVRGHLVYGVNERGLEIYDVSAPPTHKFIVRIPPDEYAYIWRRVGWLPTDVGTLTSGCCMGMYFGQIAVMGDYLYGFGPDQVSIYSLKDPVDPQLVRRIDRQLGSVYGSKVNGGFLFGSSFYGGEVSMLDTRDPAHAFFRKVSFGERTGKIKAFDEKQLLFLDRKTFKNDKADELVLKIFDISDPFHPRLMSTYAPLKGDVYEMKIRLVDNLVFIESGDVTLDISDVAQPKVIDAGPPYPDKFTRQGDLLLAYYTNLEIRSAARPDETLAKLDIPLLNSPHDVPEGMIHSGAWLDSAPGRVATLAGWSDSVRSCLSVIDTSDPAHPVLLAQMVVDSAMGVEFYGDYLYLHQLDDGVGIYKLVAN